MAAEARERELMKDIKGWKIGSVYNSERYVYHLARGGTRLMVQVCSSFFHSHAIGGSSQRETVGLCQVFDSRHKHEDIYICIIPRFQGNAA